MTVSDRQAHPPRNRIGYIYRQRRSKKLWKVTGPVDLLGWVLWPLDGGLRPIKRTSAELDDTSKWNPFSWPAAGRCGRCGMKGCKGIDSPDDCPYRMRRNGVSDAV